MTYEKNIRGTVLIKIVEVIIITPKLGGARIL